MLKERFMQLRFCDRKSSGRHQSSSAPPDWSGSSYSGKGDSTTCSTMHDNKVSGRDPSGGNGRAKPPAFKAPSFAQDVTQEADTSWRIERINVQRVKYL